MLALVKGPEWIGGIISTSPIDSTPNAPLVHLVQWLEGETAVGTSSVRAGALSEIVEALRLAVKAPTVGSARTPGRVRVASPEWAKALRAAFPTIAIVCAPTPEIERVALMVACWKKNADGGGGYLKAPITPHSIEKFFRGSSSFVRGEPWRVIPDEACPLAVSIPPFRLHDAVVVILKDPLSLILLASAADYHAWERAASVSPAGGSMNRPGQIQLRFDHEYKLDPGQREEIATYGWEVAARNRCPVAFAKDENGETRSPTQREFDLLGLVALGLSRVLAQDARALEAAWRGGPAYERSIPVGPDGREGWTFRVPIEGYDPSGRKPRAPVLRLVKRVGDG